MLTIDKPKKGGSAGGYYFRYYTRDAPEPGFWFGRGADLLGLPVDVRQNHFNNLLDGLSPDGSRELVQNVGKVNRRAFWDLTFSVPKALSTLYAGSLEHRSEIRRVIETPLRSTLMEVEESLGMSRQGKDGKRIVPGALTFGVFFHETSRANDPQLHFHCVLVNVAVRPDGTTGGVFSKPIFEEKMRIGDLFREKLAEELRQQLGLEIRMTKNSFEIEGVPQELNDTFSKRSKQLRSYMEKHGLTSSSEAKVAAVKTRGPKKFVDRQVLSARWGEVSKAHGFGPEKVEAVWRRGQAKLKEKVSQEEEFEAQKKSKQEEPKRENKREESKAKAHGFASHGGPSNDDPKREQHREERQRKRAAAQEEARSRAQSKRSEKERRRFYRRFEKELREVRDKIFVENQSRERLMKVGFALAYKHGVDRNLVSGAVDKLKLPIQRRFYRIEWTPLFPKSGIPFIRNLRVRKYVLFNKQRRWGEIKWKFEIPTLAGKRVVLASQRRKLFPSALSSRLRNLTFPAYRIRKEERKPKIEQTKKTKLHH